MAITPCDGEGLEKRNLPPMGGPHLRPDDRDDTEGHALAQQRDGEHRALPVAALKVLAHRELVVGLRR